MISGKPQACGWAFPGKGDASDGATQLTGRYHPTAISAKPRDNLASCASDRSGRGMLRDYVTPHANARALAFAMGVGDPPGSADGHLMPADNRQTRENSIQ